MIGEKQITGKTWPNTPKQTLVFQHQSRRFCIRVLPIILFSYLVIALKNWSKMTQYQLYFANSIFIESVWSLMNSMKGKMLYMLENSNSLKFCIVDS